MAIIRLGTTVTGIRGTLGGVTYSANKNGPYAKSWARPPIGRTARKNPARARLAQVASAWRNVDAADQADWDDWAANTAPDVFNSLGEQIFLSGFQWFVALNTNRAYLAEAIQETAPTEAYPAAPTITSVDMEEDGTSTIVFPANTFLDWNIHVRVAKIPSLGIVSTARPNYLNFMRLGLTAGTARGITVKMGDLYGQFQADERFFFFIARATTDGLVGPETFVETTVVP